MTRSIRTTLLYSATLASLLLLGACGKHSEPPPPAPPAAAASTPAMAGTTAAAALNTAAPATAGSAAAPVASQSVGMAPPVAPAATAPAIAPLAVAKVTLGNKVNDAQQVTHASSSFASDDKTIYASVDTTGSSDGATLNAKWSYLEGKGQLVSSISQAIATDGPAITTFKVENPDLWPEGKYNVVISLDGKPVATQKFVIKKR